MKDSCDPYTAMDHNSGDTCGSHCAASASDTYSANLTSIGRVPWTTAAETEANIQQQILTRGAIVSCFFVYSDFYGGGVYIQDPAASVRGGHAVVTIGWGVDNGVKYWLVENSHVPTTTAPHTLAISLIFLVLNKFISLITSVPFFDIVTPF